MDRSNPCIQTLENLVALGNFCCDTFQSGSDHISSGGRKAQIAE